MKHSPFIVPSPMNTYVMDAIYGYDGCGCIPHASNQKPLVTDGYASYAVPILSGCMTVMYFNVVGTLTGTPIITGAYPGFEVGGVMR